MKRPEFLGLHGAVIESARPAAEAARWARRGRLPVLRRNAREIRLGFGPELFVTFRKGSFDRPRVTELHVAVRDLEGRGRADALGGDSLIFNFPGVRLVLRQFRRAPRGSWTPARRGSPPRPAARARGRSPKTGSKSGG